MMICPCTGWHQAYSAAAGGYRDMRGLNDTLRQTFLVVAALGACLLMVDTVLRATGIGGLSIPDSRWQKVEETGNIKGVCVCERERALFA